ncbi:ABC transporter permease [Nocardioides houyundeii]|uniref:ABC transporter permease n=1 Tax=Nocardioides houyundeii TaxID=2045452 RepID=UPI001F084EB6|nr:ABC transporter permease [Nocardioides houyundeii]
MTVSNRRGLWTALITNPSGVVGGILLLLVLGAAVLAPVLSPHDPNETRLNLTFQPPGTVGLVLGTDDLGRDVLSRMLYAMRASLEVGLLAVLLALVVGTFLGLMAGYWRKLDWVVSQITDVNLAFPYIITAVALAAVSGPSASGAAVAIGISQIPVMTRVVRAETLRVKSSDFVLNARTMNASGAWIVTRHILPNAASAIIVQATVIVPTAVIAEALLSFLGLGTRPPQASLGVMLSNAQSYISQAPTGAIFPGLVIVVICLAFNLVGDALSDALDPMPVPRKRRRLSRSPS